ncbi:MAG: DUF6069 family protein [Actinobacteria bacterium]|nr:DUF6069 family protein [Actinomycetota bacterium]
MEDAQISHVQGEHVSFKRLLWAGPLAAVSAAVANAVVYFVASALGTMPQDFVVQGSGPITLAPVVVSSLIGAAGAAVIFTIVALLTRRPIRTFRVVAAVVLALSFATPLTIPGAPLSMILTLELMHVVAAVIIVGMLTTLARVK